MLRSATGAAMLISDIRYSLHSLRNAPLFTLAAVLSLAVGIGANTSIFSVASALYLRPLPYSGADRLVILWNRSPGLNITQDWFSTAQYFDIRSGFDGFEQIALAIGGNRNLTGYGDPQRVGVVSVSSNLLPMLGVSAAQGRLITAADDTPRAEPSALLTHGAWSRRYGADPKMMGRSITLNGQSFRVVGILPASFALPREVLPTLYGAEHPEIFLPLPLPAAASNTRSGEDYNVIGKLKPGVSVAQAQAAMDALTARLRHDFPSFYPSNGGLTFSVVPLSEQVSGEVRRPMAILLGATALVLLIACANVANLSLSRALSRQKEMAVRNALGASRARLFRLLLTESVLLALMAGATGVVLSHWCVDLVRALGAGSVPRLEYIGINAQVLGFTLLLTLAAALLCGLVPAWRLSGPLLIRSRGNTMRRTLVVVELGLSLLLLVGAGLLARSFARLQNVPPGFHPDNVLTFGLTMSGRQYAKRENVIETYRRLWDRLDQIPGAQASGGTSALPLSRMFSWGPIVVEGRTPAPGESFLNADMRVVAGRYFEVMRIPLLRGRLFNNGDTPEKPRVVIVEDHMAAQVWPGQDPVGKRFRPGGFDAREQWWTVAGVVGAIRHESLDARPRIAFYLPHTQYPARELSVVLRGSGDPSRLAAPAVAAVHDIDPDLPAYQVRTMRSRVDESLARRRFSTSLMGLFAMLALVLSVSGVYGVVSCLVSQSTREMGVRIALGASTSRILRLVLRRALAAAALGLLLGLIGALLLSRSLASMLFNTSPTDPLTFTGVVLMLATVSTLASLAPARRAARVDPAASLRAD